MKKGKFESMDALHACCLEVSRLASGNLTDNKKCIQAAAWNWGGGGLCSQPDKFLVVG